MEAALAVLAIQGVLGAYDNFRNHEFREGLPHKTRQRVELMLHAAREFFYLILFPTMAWMEWRGWLAYLLGAIIVGEIMVTCWDFVEEDRTRKLSANERVLHTILTLNYGAFLALLAPVLLGWASQPTELVFVGRGYWSWLMTIYSLGVLVFGIRELSSGLSMWRQIRTIPPGSPHSRAFDAGMRNLPRQLRDLHEGEGVRIAKGTVSVSVGRGLARILLRFMGLRMEEGPQSLLVTFEPDGHGELWRRTFGSGGFTSRVEFDASDKQSIIELFGPISLYYHLRADGGSITWTLCRARFFGFPIPAALAPRVTAREWVSADERYSMSAEVVLPFLGHLLSYTGTLARVTRPTGSY